MSIGASDVRAWLADYAAVIAEHRAELVALDTAIGDGDHGTNMHRGMGKAIEKLDAAEQADPGAVLGNHGRVVPDPGPDVGGADAHPQRRAGVFTGASHSRVRSSSSFSSVIEQPAISSEVM